MYVDKYSLRLKSKKAYIPNVNQMLIIFSQSKLTFRPVHQQWYRLYSVVHDDA